jgi:hypothetical protein
MTFSGQSLRNRKTDPLIDTSSFNSRAMGRVNVFICGERQYQRVFALARFLFPYP